MASATWIASSRVGVMTRACTRRCAGSIAESIGSANAAVLPVPVCARPRTSRPDSSSGMVSVWIGVGVSNPDSTRVGSRRSATPSAANPVAGSSGVALGGGVFGDVFSGFGRVDGRLLGAGVVGGLGDGGVLGGRRVRGALVGGVGDHVDELDVVIGQDSSVGHRISFRKGTADT